ncbi:MAG: PorT family protein [Bacteroidetes bacterium]|nr:PorT family protein [Bacteroidota bacterium]
MRKIFIICLLMGSALLTSAKQKFGIDLGIGAKAGVNLNKVEGIGLKNTFNSDPHAGFFIHVNKRRVGIQIEAVWSQNHMITDSSFNGFYKQYIKNFDDSLTIESYRFSTISIPLLLNIKPAQWLWIQLGPQFDANVNVVSQHHIVKSGLDVIKKNNYSAVGGVWVQLGGKAPVLRVNLGARYVVGLDNLNALTNVEIWKNHMLQIHIGISY